MRLAKPILLIVAIFTLSQTVSAQVGETFRINSKRIGEEREIRVYLPSSYANSKQELRLASMSAKLFYETSGTFSQDVFTNQVNLWNTVIEGASREGASESMLVTIEIKAVGNSWTPTNRKVQKIFGWRYPPE